MQVKTFFGKNKLRTCSVHIILNPPAENWLSELSSTLGSTALKLCVFDWRLWLSKWPPTHRVTFKLWLQNHKCGEKAVFMRMSGTSVTYFKQPNVVQLLARNSTCVTWHSNNNLDVVMFSVDWAAGLWYGWSLFCFAMESPDLWMKCLLPHWPCQAEGERRETCYTAVLIHWDISFTDSDIKSTHFWQC